MTKNFRISVSVIALGAIVAQGCAGRKVQDTPSPERLFEEAVQAAESGGLFGSRDCYTAERKVEELRRRYPYHSATVEGELVLADCAYAEKRAEEAIGRWEAFLRFHSGHGRQADVWIRLARAYKDLYDDYDRDLGSVKQALHAASTVVRDFPTTEIAQEAAEIRAWAREILAKREYYVARQYRRRGDLLSAKGRLEYLVQAFPETAVATEAQGDLKQIVKRLDFPQLPTP